MKTLEKHIASLLSDAPVPTMKDYTVTINTDPSYYGDCTTDDAVRIAQNLRSMIEAEFPGIRCDVRDVQGGGKTTGPDETTIEQIDAWIGENWTAAL